MEKPAVKTAGGTCQDGVLMTSTSKVPTESRTSGNINLYSVMWCFDMTFRLLDVVM